MTKEKLISLIEECNEKVDINSLKEYSLPALEKDFIKEAFSVIKKRASNEFSDLMKNNYKSDYSKLKKNISEISIKANTLNNLLNLDLEDLPSALGMAILLKEPNILEALFKQKEEKDIENLKYCLAQLVLSLEKNNSTYYADITLKSHSRMDQPIFLSVNGNYENIRDIAIAKIKETLPKDIEQKFECYISFYSKHIIEDKTVFNNTECFQICVVNKKIAFSKITY